MARRDLFTGRSGQLAVMAEFLIREMNVAIPEVDVGDDIVVVRDDHDLITRVQVKTANARAHRKSDDFAARFRLSVQQLQYGPELLVYAFVVRHVERWQEFVIVPRAVLWRLRTEHSIGSEDGSGGLLLELTFTPESVLLGRINLQPFRSRFLPWPPSPNVPEGLVPPVT